MQIDCKYKENCSGCRHIGTPLEQQHRAKREHLQDLLQQAGIASASPLRLISPAPAGLRDRADLVVHGGHLGLYEKDTRNVVDLEDCAQMSPALDGWLRDVRKRTWPVTKGSLRLRVGPHGQRGIWLDFANVDIKKILDEKTWLLKLQEEAHVEIGQRHKVPVFENGIYKLRDPEMKVWFQTWLEDRPIDLYCSIGSFTQPSLAANREILRTITPWLDRAGSKNILEFGSGIGNLSFALAGTLRTLATCEIDGPALDGFRKSLAALSANSEFSDLNDRIQIFRGDFQNKQPQNFEKFDTVVVNPPRSGLKQFIKPLLGLASGKPQNFIYMSCYPRSFVDDGIQLQSAGYWLSEISILDQFPQTDHYEVLSLWSLK